MTCGAPSPGGSLACEREPHGDHGHVWVSGSSAPDGRHTDAVVDW